MGTIIIMYQRSIDDYWVWRADERELPGYNRGRTDGGTQKRELQCARETLQRLCSETPHVRQGDVAGTAGMPTPSQIGYHWQWRLWEDV